MSQKPTPDAVEPSPMALALAFVYQMGRERERFEQEIAKKIGAQLATAFDDGFVLGRKTGLQDAQDRSPDPDRPAGGMLS